MVNLGTDEMASCQKRKAGHELSAAATFPGNSTDHEGAYIDVYHEDWRARKKRRQQLASRVISYVIVTTVLVMILFYTRHLVEICRNNSYFRLPD